MKPRKRRCVRIEVVDLAKGQIVAEFHLKPGASGGAIQRLLRSAKKGWPSHLVRKVYKDQETAIEELQRGFIEYMNKMFRAALRQKEV